MKLPRTRKKLLISPICVINPSPDNNHIPNASAEAAGAISHITPLMKKRKPAVNVAIFNIQFITYHRRN